MSLKRYATLIIAKEPVDLSSLDLEEREEVDHFISVELEVKSDGDGTFSVSKALSVQTLKQVTEMFRGKGASVGCAITSFFHDVMCSFSYDPIRNRRQRQRDERKKEKLIFDSFVSLVFADSDCVMPEIEFRVPKIGEVVIVHHLLLRCEKGTVINTTPDSSSGNVTVMIDGARRFPIVYTFDEKSLAWMCREGEYKADAACYIALHPKGVYSAPIKFTLLFPPTDAAKAYANRIYLNRDKMRILTGNDNP